MASVKIVKGQPVKVMRVIARLNVGGPAVHCDLLSRNLNEHGFQTTLVAGSTEEGEASYEELFLKESSSYRLVKLPRMRRKLNFIGDLISFLKLLELMRKEKPQIVHTHTAKAGFLGRIAASLTGVPLVVHTYHGHVLSGYFSKTFSQVITFLERVLATQTKALVTLSPQLKEILSTEFKVAPSSKFHIVPLGRDLKPFLNLPLKSREPGLRVFGVIGRLVPIKAHHFLLDALEELETSVSWKLLVVGEGPLSEELKTRVQNSKRLKSRVEFLGWRSDLPNIYGQFDFSVLTSLNEGTPLSIIESFASACPVLSTDVGGVRDMLTLGIEKDEVTHCAEGLLVPSQNRKALVKALKKLLEDDSFREACSVAARTRSMAYTEEALTQRVANLYNQLLGQTVSA